MILFSQMLQLKMKSRRIILLSCKTVYGVFSFDLEVTWKKCYYPVIIKGHKCLLSRDDSFENVTQNGQDLKVVMCMCCLTTFNAIRTHCTCAENKLRFSCPRYKYFVNHLCRVCCKVTVREAELIKRQRTLISLGAFMSWSYFYAHFNLYYYCFSAYLTTK